MNNNELKFIVSLQDKATQQAERLLATLGRFNHNFQASIALKLAGAEQAIASLGAVQKLMGGIEKWGLRIGDILVGAFALGGAAITIGMGVALAAVSKQIISINSDMEQFQVSLQTTLGSLTAAKKEMSGIVIFAKETPYQIKQVTEAVVKLRAYAMDSSKWLTPLGNAASAFGRDITDAVEMAADAVQGMFRRALSYGIRMERNDFKEGGKYAGMTYADALMMELNKRFKGGMALQSKTFKGIMSNIKDTMYINFQKASKPAFDIIKGLISDVYNKINTPEMTARIQDFFGKFTNIMYKVVDSLKTVYSYMSVHIVPVAISLGKTMMQTFSQVSAAIGKILKSTLLPLLTVFVSLLQVVGKLVSWIQPLLKYFIAFSIAVKIWSLLNFHVAATAAGMVATGKATTLLGAQMKQLGTRIGVIAVAFAAMWVVSTWLEVRDNLKAIGNAFEDVAGGVNKTKDYLVDLGNAAGFSLKEMTKAALAAKDFGSNRTNVLEIGTAYSAKAKNGLSSNLNFGSPEETVQVIGKLSKAIIVLGDTEDTMFKKTNKVAEMLKWFQNNVNETGITVDNLVSNTENYSDIMGMYADNMGEFTKIVLAWGKAAKAVGQSADLSQLFEYLSMLKAPTSEMFMSLPADTWISRTTDQLKDMNYVMKNMVPPGTASKDVADIIKAAKDSAEYIEKLMKEYGIKPNSVQASAKIVESSMEKAKSLTTQMADDWEKMGQVATKMGGTIGSGVGGSRRPLVEGASSPQGSNFFSRRLNEMSSNLPNVIGSVVAIVLGTLLVGKWYKKITTAVEATVAQAATYTAQGLSGARLGSNEALFTKALPKNMLSRIEYAINAQTKIITKEGDKTVATLEKELTKLTQSMDKLEFSIIKKVGGVSALSLKPAGMDNIAFMKTLPKEMFKTLSDSEKVNIQNLRSLTIDKIEEIKQSLVDARVVAAKQMDAMKNSYSDLAKAVKTGKVPTALQDTAKEIVTLTEKLKLPKKGMSDISKAAEKVEKSGGRLSEKFGSLGKVLEYVSSVPLLSSPKKILQGGLKTPRGAVYTTGSIMGDVNALQGGPAQMAEHAGAIAQRRWITNKIVGPIQQLIDRAIPGGRGSISLGGLPDLSPLVDKILKRKVADVVTPASDTNLAKRLTDELNAFNSTLKINKKAQTVVSDELVKLRTSLTDLTDAVKVGKEAALSRLGILQAGASVAPKIPILTPVVKTVETLGTKAFAESTRDLLIPITEAASRAATKAAAKSFEDSLVLLHRQITTEVIDTATQTASETASKIAVGKIAMKVFDKAVMATMVTDLTAAVVKQPTVMQTSTGTQYDVGPLKHQAEAADSMLQASQTLGDATQGLLGIAGTIATMGQVESTRDWIGAFKKIPGDIRDSVVSMKDSIKDNKKFMDYMYSHGMTVEKYNKANAELIGGTGKSPEVDQYVQLMAEYLRKQQGEGIQAAITAAQKRQVFAQTVAPKLPSLPSVSQSQLSSNPVAVTGSVGEFDKQYNNVKKAQEATKQYEQTLGSTGYTITEVKKLFKDMDADLSRATAQFNFASAESQDLDEQLGKLQIRLGQINLRLTVLSTTMSDVGNAFDLAIAQNELAVIDTTNQLQTEINGLNMTLAKQQQALAPLQTKLNDISAEYDRVSEKISKATEDLNNFLNPKIAGEGAYQDQIYAVDKQLNALNRQKLDITAGLRVYEEAGLTNTDAYKRASAPLQAVEDQIASLENRRQKIELDRTIATQDINHYLEKERDTRTELNDQQIKDGVKAAQRVLKANEPILANLEKQKTAAQDRVTAQEALIQKTQDSIASHQAELDLIQAKLTAANNEVTAAQKKMDIQKKVLDLTAATTKAGLIGMVVNGGISPENIKKLTGMYNTAAKEAASLTVEQTGLTNQVADLTFTKDQIDALMTASQATQADLTEKINNLASSADLLVQAVSENAFKNDLVAVFGPNVDERLSTMVNFLADIAHEPRPLSSKNDIQLIITDAAKGVDWSVYGSDKNTPAPAIPAVEKVSKKVAVVTKDIKANNKEVVESTKNAVAQQQQYINTHIKNLDKIDKQYGTTTKGINTSIVNGTNSITGIDISAFKALGTAAYNQLLQGFGYTGSYLPTGNTVGQSVPKTNVGIGGQGGVKGGGEGSPVSGLAGGPGAFISSIVQDFVNRGASTNWLLNNALNGGGNMPPGLGDAGSLTGWLHLQPEAEITAKRVKSLFGGSFGGRAGGRSWKSDHPAGLAYDFSAGKDVMNNMAAWEAANMKALGIRMIIHNGLVNHGLGWKKYNPPAALVASRPYATAYHYDHVHTSIKDNPAGDESITAYLKWKNGGVGMPMYHQGGVTPGSQYKERLAILRGQEAVIPLASGKVPVRIEGGGSTVVNNNNNFAKDSFNFVVRDDNDIEEIKKILIKLMGNQSSYKFSPFNA